ncbi:hypothetical protein BCV71DRAFT_261283 [Rhizopus microsporus]|uniref:Uncharacterized protein n=1 Tax=Rhizopus microsporus TaxID=58291 RepID=A0A1X0SAE7_RHIZD|nr:hypothetical protein BCV71DRAFT_261283 [Rhizopus microsporus]
MLIFCYHGCGKTFQARTMMYIVQSLVSSNSLQHKRSGTRYATPTGHDPTPLDRTCIANLRQRMAQLQGLATQCNLAEHEQQHQLQQQEVAAHFLQPPFENQGFQYNTCILDIHCSDRNIVALLVRNDYASELRKQLERFKITFKDDFEPCGTKVLRDPEYANL